MPESCPPPFDLDLFLAQEKPRGTQPGLFDHIENCPHCMAYIARQAGEPLDFKINKPEPQPDLTSQVPPDPFAHLFTPSQFGDYQVVRRLGQGGMGVVYECRDIVLSRHVALKVLNFNKLSSDALVRIEHEATVQSRLNHPNIVTVHEFRKSGPWPFIVMELVQGQPLSHWLQGSPIPPRTAAEIVARLARTIDYAHKMGVVHRDLKPANVLVTGDIPAHGPDNPSPLEQADSWSLKVIDFGLSKWLQGEAQNITLSSNIVGTPAYLAPELTRPGSKQVGPSVDIYALGVILYQCLIGRPPFVAENALLPMDLIRNLEPVAPMAILPTLPRDLNTICLKCLQKEPARRYATALELAEELQRFLGGFPIQARPLGPLAISLRWCGRNRSLAKALAATALLFMLLIVGSIYFGYSQARLRMAAEKSDRDKQEALTVISRQTELASNYAYFWLRLINQISPDNQGRPMSILKYLDNAAQELNQDQLQTPEGKTTFQIIVANAYYRLGEHQRSEELLKNAEETLDKVLTMEIAPSFEIRESLANAYLLRKKPDQAFSLLLAVAESRLKLDRLLRISGLKSLEQLADVSLQANRPAEAIPYLEKALQLQQSRPAAAKMNTAGIRERLGNLYKATGRVQEAGAF